MNLTFMVSYLPVAMASGGEAGGQGLVSLLLMMAIIFGIFYFLVIRPQKQQQQEHEELIESLEKGDRIVTAGGIHGKVESVSGDTLKVEVTKDVKLTLNKSAISRIKGEQSSDEE